MSAKALKVKKLKTLLANIKSQEKIIIKGRRELEKKIENLTKRKMRKGGGKTKGNGFEREIVKGLFEAFAHHGISLHDINRSVLSGGHKDSFGDLSFSAAMAKLFPFAVECKFYKKIDLYELFVPYNKMRKACWFRQWWSQAKEGAAKCGRAPILIFKANSKEILCAVPLKALFTSLDGEQILKLKKKPRIVVKGDKELKEIWVIEYKLFLKMLAGESPSKKGKQ